MDNKSNDDGGIIVTLFIAAFIILVIMRVMWYIDIPWIVVFAPLWTPFILILLVTTFMEIFYKLKNKKEND
jgi:uncharacterized protein (DUF983 family)